MSVEIDSDTCTRCGTCIQVCPIGIITPGNEGDAPSVDPERTGLCLSCGQCEAFCPPGALTLNTRSTPAPRAFAGETIRAADLGVYLKSRRSIRHFLKKPVDRETIKSILDIARYAASAGNGQPVEWLVIHDPARVQEIARLTADWMRTMAAGSHPLGAYVRPMITAFDAGGDPICRNAPHLVIPHVQEEEGRTMVQTDAIIALTHVDITAPAFGVGTCWAGWVAMAARSSALVATALALPEGRVAAHAMMLGYPRYKPAFIPERKPLTITWQ